MNTPVFNFVNTVDLFVDNKHNPNLKPSQFLVEHDDHPGLLNYKGFSKYYGTSVVCDRTGTITSPFNVVLHDTLKMPEYRVSNKTYEECALERARELLDHAKETNRRICIFYSGGIDSTSVLIAFLRVSTEVERKNHLTVMMSFESYCENRNLYDTVIANKLHVVPSNGFNNIVGNSQYICVTAEGNDQLFGSFILKTLSIGHGNKAIEMPSTHDNLVSLLHNTTNTRYQTENYMRLLKQVASKAPVSTDSMSSFLWWCNFALKWQCVYFRVLGLLTPEQRKSIALNDNYVMFFNTDDFQLWSMNNSDKLIGNTIKSYKYVCKEFIYDFDKNAEYRDHKMKIGSLAKVSLTKKMTVAIDTDLNFYDTPPDASVLLKTENSFAF